MFWPLTQLASLFHRQPTSIELDADYRQRAIDFILERAQSLAADVVSFETTFSVVLPEHMQGEYLPAEIVGAVMLHAREYGVELQHVSHWTFFFQRYNAPSN